MLKNKIRKQIVYNVLSEKTSGEFRVNGNFVKEIAQSVNHNYNKYRGSGDNLENNLITKTVKNIDNTFFLSDVYEDFDGKNPKMNIYNSYEADKILTFLKKGRELSVFESATSFYYDFKTCLLNCDLIFLNSSYKNLLICCPLFALNLVLMFINIFAGIFFFILSGIYFVLFKTYKFLYRKERFFSKKYFFTALFGLFFILSGCLKYILIFTRMLTNAIFNFFHTLNKFVKIAVDLKNLFSFEKKNKKDKVDRKNRSTEHKFLLDFIYKNSKQKMKEAANHDLQWLKPFKIKEFVLGDFNYGALPDGEEKEYYKNLEISEKMDLLVKILQGAIRTRAKKWKYGLELMSKSEVLGAKYKPINKNLEKELSKSKILLDNLIKTAEIGVVVNNKDL